MPPIPNFAIVDDRLWRGGWPGPAGARWLAANGVKTDVDLEWETGDDDIFAAAWGVRLVRVKDFEPLPLFAPSLADQHVVAALRAILAGPSVVFVHCRQGANRTGIIVGSYRILIQGHDINSAIGEFKLYRGLWAWADERYLRGLAGRRDELLKQIKGATV